MFQSSPLESKQLVINSSLLILFMYFKNFDMLYIYVAHGRYLISFFYTTNHESNTLRKSYDYSNFSIHSTNISLTLITNFGLRKVFVSHAMRLETSDKYNTK